jgi:Flp pilus assembly protein TadG
MQFTPPKSVFKSFADDTRGYITLEAIIVFPALLVIFAASWVYFDAMRQQSVNQKANYTISDMLSRETEAIDDTYIANATQLLRMLTNASGTDSDLRVSIAQYDADAAAWQLRWSRQNGDQPALSSLDGYDGRLPATAEGGEQLILVETWDAYDPVFEVGLAPFEIRTYSFTRPRYAPQVVFDG